MKLSSVRILILVLCSISHAAELTWPNVYQIATQNSLELKIAREKHEQAKLNQTLATSSFYPQLSASLGSSRSQNGSQDPTNAYNYGFSARQLVFDGFNTWNKQQAATYQTQAAEHELTQSQATIRLNARTAFIELLIAQQNIDLTQKIALRRKETLELISLRYAAGREHKGSLLTAQAQYAQAAYEIEKATHAKLIAEARLKKVLNVSTATELRVTESLATTTVAQQTPDYEQLIDRSPLLQQTLALQKAKANELAASYTDYWPQVSLSGSTGKNGNTWPPETNTWSVGGSVSYTLFDGFSREASIAKAQSSLRQAELSLLHTRNDLVLQLTEAWTTMIDQQTAVGVQEQFLTAAEERATIAHGQYGIGLITFDNWVIIEDNLISAQKTLLQLQGTVLNKEAEWLYTQGEVRS